MMTDAPEHDRIRASVKAGLQDAISDPQTWVMVRQAFKDYARTEAGNLVLGAAWGLVKKVVFGVGIIALLYKFGGMAAVMAWLDAGKH